MSNHKPGASYLASIMIEMDLTFMDDSFTSHVVNGTIVSTQKNTLKKRGKEEERYMAHRYKI